MRAKIFFITLAVDDLERSVLFHRDGLVLADRGHRRPALPRRGHGRGWAIAFFTLDGGLLLACMSGPTSPGREPATRPAQLDRVQPRNPRRIADRGRRGAPASPSRRRHADRTRPHAPVRRLLRLLRRSRRSSFRDRPGLQQPNSSGASLTATRRGPDSLPHISRGIASRFSLRDARIFGSARSAGRGAQSRRRASAHQLHPSSPVAPREIPALRPRRRGPPSRSFVLLDQPPLWTGWAVGGPSEVAERRGAVRTVAQLSAAAHAATDRGTRLPAPTHSTPLPPRLAPPARLRSDPAAHSGQQRPDPGRRPQCSPVITGLDCG